MKKLTALLFTLCSSLVFAGSYTNTMRTGDGQLVNVGDTEESLIEKMGKAKPKYYVLDDGKFYCAATEYKYDIDLQQFTVTLCRGKIVKIWWENK